MPTPSNVKSLQQLLGMVQYLAKFLPQLSTVTEPLRQLVHKSTDWQWSAEHDNAVRTIKDLICRAPVLRYFDPALELTLQCDASESGLGYALLQQGQPVAFGARGMTQTERKYAQIEKEMLAIVCGCEKFDQYIYGHSVTIETDHKPLVSISQKLIHHAPKRLQRMLLRMQRYNFKITYKRGSEMYLADALSRAYPEQCTAPTSQPPSEFCHAMEELDLTEHLPISSSRLKQIQEATTADHTLQILKSQVISGWAQKSEVPLAVRPYVKCQDELSTQNGILFKGSRIILPASLRREMLQKIHEGHLGVESCLKRAREVFYWPLMTSEVKDLVSNCSVCNAVQPSQAKEPLLAHEIPQRPWSKVATDLFSINGDNFVVIVDYYSNFIEVERVASTASRPVIQALKVTFGRHGIPDSVVSDNGPAFASDEFKKFAIQWEFQHITTSPHYPQANGKAESAVKICKTLMKKAKLANTDLQLALLNQRNTPTKPTNLSPAQRLFGRRTRTQLPLSAALLTPETPQLVPAKLALGQQKQAQHYDRSAKPLKALRTGELVYLKIPGSKTWTKGTCTRQVAPRSYLVEYKGHLYRRNCRHLRRTHSTTFPANDLDWDDSDSEEGEGREGNTEPTDARPQITERSAITRLPARGRNTSSFGRVIKPPQRYIEQTDT